MYRIDQNTSPEEFARQIEQINKLFPDQASGGWTYMPPVYPPAPCPSCGHCPTCGHKTRPWRIEPYISW